MMIIGTNNIKVGIQYHNSSLLSAGNFLPCNSLIFCELFGSP